MGVKVIEKDLDNIYRESRCYSASTNTKPMEIATVIDNYRTNNNCKGPDSFYQSFQPENLHPRIESILYWRNIKRTSLVFFGGLLWFGAVARYNLIAVFSHMSLALLTTSLAIKIWNTMRGKRDVLLNWPKFENLDMIVLNTLHTFIALAIELRDLFFVKSIFKTLKFAFVLYAWTYVGSLLNGFSLVVNVFICLFTVPKTCELLQPTLIKTETWIKKKRNELMAYFNVKISFWKSQVFFLQGVLCVAYKICSEELNYFG